MEQQYKGEHLPCTWQTQDWSQQILWSLINVGGIQCDPNTKKREIMKIILIDCYMWFGIFIWEGVWDTIPNNDQGLLLFLCSSRTLGDDQVTTEFIGFRFGSQILLWDYHWWVWRKYRWLGVETRFRYSYARLY